MDPAVGLTGSRLSPSGAEFSVGALDDESIPREEIAHAREFVAEVIRRVAHRSSRAEGEMPFVGGSAARGLNRALSWCWMGYRLRRRRLGACVTAARNAEAERGDREQGGDRSRLPGRPAACGLAASILQLPLDGDRVRKPTQRRLSLKPRPVGT